MFSVLLIDQILVLTIDPSQMNAHCDKLGNMPFIFGPVVNIGNISFSHASFW